MLIFIHQIFLSFKTLIIWQQNFCLDEKKLIWEITNKHEKIPNKIYFNNINLIYR